MKPSCVCFRSFLKFLGRQKKAPAQASFIFGLEPSALAFVGHEKCLSMKNVGEVAAAHIAHST